jgi:hypothetical protein
LKRDFYLSSDEAVRYGLIDKVLMPAPRKRSTTGKDVDLGAFEGDDVQKFQNQKGGKMYGVVMGFIIKIGLMLVKEFC